MHDRGPGIADGRRRAHLRSLLPRRGRPLAARLGARPVHRPRRRRALPAAGSRPRRRPGGGATVGFTLPLATSSLDDASDVPLDPPRAVTAGPADVPRRRPSTAGDSDELWAPPVEVRPPHAGDARGDFPRLGDSQHGSPSLWSNVVTGAPQFEVFIDGDGVCIVRGELDEFTGSDAGGDDAQPAGRVDDRPRRGVVRRFGRAAVRCSSCARSVSMPAATIGVRRSSGAVRRVMRLAGVAHLFAHDQTACRPATPARRPPADRRARAPSGRHPARARCAGRRARPRATSPSTVTRERERPTRRRGGTSRAAPAQPGDGAGRRSNVTRPFVVSETHVVVRADPASSRPTVHRRVADREIASAAGHVEGRDPVTVPSTPRACRHRAAPAR